MSAREWIQLPEQKVVLRKLTQYRKGAGCFFPYRECEFCEAWCAGYRGQKRPALADPDLSLAFDLGALARKRVRKAVA